MGVGDGDEGGRGLVEPPAPDLGMGAAAPSRLPRPVHRADRLEHRLDDAERRRGVADGRPVGVADARRARADRDAAPGVPRRNPGGRAGRHRRPPPPADRQPDVDARHRGPARLPVPGRCGDAALAAHADVLPRCRHGPDAPGLASHPAGAGPAGRVPPGHRPRRAHVQPRPGGRTGARRCGRGARRAGLGLPDQRGVVPRRRRRAHLVAAADLGLDPAGRDHDRSNAGGPPLRPELDRPPPRADPLRGVRRARRRAPRPAPGRGPRPARPGVRRLRAPARLLRRRCRGRGGAAPPDRRRAQPRPHPAREHRDRRRRAAHRRPGGERVGGRRGPLRRRGRVDPLLHDHERRRAGGATRMGASPRHGPVQPRHRGRPGPRQRALGDRGQPQPGRVAGPRRGSDGHRHPRHAALEDQRLRRPRPDPGAERRPHRDPGAPPDRRPRARHHPLRGARRRRRRLRGRRCGASNASAAGPGPAAGASTATWPRPT